jgi:hypothetical protein
MALAISEKEILLFMQWNKVGISDNTIRTPE